MQQRKTLIGRFTYYLGKIVALYYLMALSFSAKNIIYPEYSSNKISRRVYTVLNFLSLYKAEDELFYEILIQYVSLVFIGALIASNIRSFMRNLLMTLKNLLRDQLIQISYNTTILVFSFVMGTYYLSVLL